MNYFDEGDVIRLTAAFTNSGGGKVDPSTVTLQYRQFLADPSSFTTLVFGVDSITRVSTGDYYHDLNVSSGGEWRYRWNGLGGHAAAAEQRFMVRWRSVGP